MKIAFVITNLSCGGAERVLSIVANYCSKKNHTVKIVLLQDDAIDYEILSDIDVEYLERKKNNLFCNIHRIIKLRKALKGYGVVISFLWHINIYTVLATRFSKKKVIISDRCDPLNELGKTGGFAVKLRNICYGLADKIVFQTQGAMECYSPHIRKKGIVIANPLTPHIPYWKDAPKTEKYVSTSCRLSPQKNLKMAIDAFGKFHENHPDYVYYIYGEGELRLWLERYIAEKELEKAVFLPGFVSDVFGRIAGSAMFVLSSDYEGISNSMLEALAMGVPTVVTDSPPGGARAFIQDGQNGFLVPVGDMETLYDRMSKIANDEGFAHLLSENAVKIRDILNEEAICDQWLMLLEEV